MLISNFIVAILYISTFYLSEPADPTTQEAEAFQRILERIRDNESSLPESISEVVRSLTEEVRREVDCPAGSPVEKVIIKIRTRQIHFDPGLSIGGESAQLPGNRTGYYVWRPRSTVVGDEKIVEANNFIMLDPKIMEQQKADAVGRLALEGLLYHEFLHGQLQINAITTNDEWISDLCSCTFSLQPSDESHSTIPGLVEGYWSRVTSGNLHLSVVAPPPPKSAEEDGSFEIEIDINGLEKDPESISVLPYFPDGDNIDQSSLSRDIRADKIVVKGRLVDKTRRGLILIQIDPPSTYVFVGLEEMIVIRPLGGGDVVTTWWISFAFIMVFIIGMILFLYRRGKGTMT